MPHTQSAGPTLSRKSLEDFEFLLAQHDSQLISVKGEISEVKQKLDQVFSAINSLTVASGKSPFDIAGMVSTLRDIVLIFGAVVSGIIYVTTSQFSADWARQGEYNKQIVRELNAMKSPGTPNQVPMP